MKWQIFWIALALISVLYGLLVVSTRSGTLFFTVWLVIGAVFLLFALAAHVHLWQKTPAVLHAVVIAAAVICAAVFCFAESRILSAFCDEKEDGLDYIVVLGAQVYSHGPSIVLQYRLDAAYDYMMKNENTICIVTGGQGYNEPFTEAKGMADYLIGRGISPERIIREDKSRSTLENIRNSMAFFNPEKDSVGIVTNDFHLYRGVAIAKKAGIRHVSGIKAWSKRSFLPNNLLREFFGVTKDYLKGNI